jgi:hypothetical protein
LAPIFYHDGGKPDARGERLENGAVGHSRILVHNTSGTPGRNFSQQFQGMTNQQIVRSLGSQQLDLLRQWMGRGVQGAQQAMGRPLPQGLTADTLRSYHEIARRQIEAGLDTLGTQAARLELIEQALQAMGN